MSIENQKYFAKIKNSLPFDSKMGKVIAVDFDETLAETIEGALIFHNHQIKGIPVSKEDIENYYLHRIKKLNITHDGSTDRFNSFLDSKASKNIKSIPGAKMKLEERKSKGYNLYIITARQDKDIETTKYLINKYFPGIFDEKKIIFANHYTEKEISKADLCEEIGAEIMIEDNLDYAQELAIKGITIYLLKKPRNKQYDNSNPRIIHVDSRNDINL